MIIKCLSGLTGSGLGVVLGCLRKHLAAIFELYAGGP